MVNACCIVAQIAQSYFLPSLILWTLLKHIFYARRAKYRSTDAPSPTSYGCDRTDGVTFSTFEIGDCLGLSVGIIGNFEVVRIGDAAS